MPEVIVVETKKTESRSKGGGGSPKRNRIQVSNTKKPLFFYVNLAKIEILLRKSENFDNLVIDGANTVTLLAITVVSDFANVATVASKMVDNVGLSAENKEDEKEKNTRAIQVKPQPQAK